MGHAGAEANLDGFTTAVGAVALPGATTRGPAEEAPLEEAECGAEAGDAVEAPETAVAVAAAAARVRPPRPSNWGAMTKDQKRHWCKRGGKRR